MEQVRTLSTQMQALSSAVAAEVENMKRSLAEAQVKHDEGMKKVLLEAPKAGKKTDGDGRATGGRGRATEIRRNVQYKWSIFASSYRVRY